MKSNMISSFFSKNKSTEEQLNKSYIDRYLSLLQMQAKSQEINWTDQNKIINRGDTNWNKLS